ncbi:MAG: hypothetical protein HQ517_08685 [SAR324 cluster bacterium]|nr:hypothetical protein [SAR324 cluster bacterium]
MGNEPESRDRNPDKTPALLWLDYVRKSDEELLKICRVDIFRGSGRGGQKRNKTTNAIRLTLFNLAVTESASRSKAQNVDHALKKLRVAIALETSPEFRRGGNPGPFPEEIQPYLFREVIRIHPQNPVFPIFIGYLVDHFIKYEGKWSIIASHYRISSSQIRRFIEKHPSLHMTLERIRDRLPENRIKPGEPS